MTKYILTIDQSTQATKVMLFDELGRMVAKKMKKHEQLINDAGWISHDLDEIYGNVLENVAEILKDNSALKEEIVAVGITNQRETAAAWYRSTGHPICQAIVWQDDRAADICNMPRLLIQRKKIKEKTGLNLAPYFSAAKFSWILKNDSAAAAAAFKRDLCFGTIDAWLLYQLTKGESNKTDYSNASRTQLLNLKTLTWDKELCELFDIPTDCLPEICASDHLFGRTDFDGILGKKIPIHCMMGDSQAALFGQGCWQEGDVKATIGTGSSVMMNIGENICKNEEQLVTSIAWKINGIVKYAVEGNINYAGAIISWLIKDLQIIENEGQTNELALSANQADTTYLVPAFTGLGGPYWLSDAKAMFVGMTRKTGKAELVRASIEAIAYQINDILERMNGIRKSRTNLLKVDGGASENSYLMQFQSNISGLIVRISGQKESSAFEIAYGTGLAAGIYAEETLKQMIVYRDYQPELPEKSRQKLLAGWYSAVECTRQEVSRNKD